MIGNNPMGEGTASDAFVYANAYGVEHANRFEPVKTPQNNQSQRRQNIAAAGDGRTP
jgi:hypothetical protein